MMVHFNGTCCVLLWKHSSHLVLRAPKTSEQSSLSKYFQPLTPGPNILPIWENGNMYWLLTQSISCILLKKEKTLNFHGVISCRVPQIGLQQAIPLYRLPGLLLTR